MCLLSDTDLLLGRTHLETFPYPFSRWGEVA